MRKNTEQQNIWQKKENLL